MTMENQYTLRKKQFPIFRTTNFDFENISHADGGLINNHFL